MGREHIEKSKIKGYLKNHLFTERKQSKVNLTFIKNKIHIYIDIKYLKMHLYSIMYLIINLSILNLEKSLIISSDSHEFAKQNFSKVVLILQIVTQFFFLYLAEISILSS